MYEHGEIIKNYLWDNFQIEVNIDEKGWEGVLLYHEEIENDLNSKRCT